MKKILIYFIVLALLPMVAVSQEREIKEEGKTFFKPHTYLQLQGGAAHTLGEAKFMDLISPAAAVNLGYQFTPMFSMRLGVSGWQGKGGWVTPAQDYDFKFVQGNLDFVFDLASLFAGFNPTRTLSPYIFAGGGYAYGFENGATDLKTGNYDLEYLWEDNKGFLGGRVGIGFNLRLNDAVALALEGNATILDDKFNSKKADNADWQFNALIGVKINLGKTYGKTEPVYYEPKPIPEPKPEPKPEPIPEPEPEPEVVVKQFPTLPSVHFEFDSDVLDTNEYATELNTIVSTLKEFDDVDVEVIGYTDHRGDKAYNDDLSLRRAESVKNYLINQGISASRLTTIGEGKDPKTSGNEALTIKARRVEVAK